MDNSDQYIKFLNWLEGEFALYQTDTSMNTLYIDYPLVSCLISKRSLKDKVEVNLEIKAQSLTAYTIFVNYVNEVYSIFKKNYINQF